MKKTLFLFGVAALFTLSAMGIRNWFAAHSTQPTTKRLDEIVASLPPIVPAVVMFREVLSVPGKPDILSTERQYAIRSDGSELRIDKQHRNDGTLYLTHWKLELADGTTAEGDDLTHTMTAVKVPRGRFGRALSRWVPASNCTEEANGANTTAAPVGYEKFLGVDTVKILLGDSAVARITVWRAPGLNCLEVRQLAEFKNPDGSLKDISDLFGTELRLGEPDPSLFAIPTGYANVSYSERNMRMAAALGAPPVPDAEKRVLERMDATFSTYKTVP